MTKNETLNLTLEFANDIQRGKYKGNAETIITAIKAALEAKDEPVAWKWHQAPVKTSWGDGMVVADLAIDKDHTVSIYCERDQTAKVEAMFTPPQQEAKDEPWTQDDMAYRPNGLPQEFIKHEVESPEDWSEWVCPNPDEYFMKCCDCGLVHEVQYRVARYGEGDYCELVNDKDVQAQFRMRRRTQPQRTWLELTNQELADCWDTIPERAMRRVEAKLKQKNFKE